ncbi:MAG: hypothetical protein O6941_00930 [Planctomycetota bacterium]|nr:hypothetical protein [Planctomycetota bacterium]
MTKAPKGQSAARAVAVLHCAAGKWRGVIATTSDDRPTILAWRKFEADQNERIDQWLDKHQVGRVIGVLPAAAVICRTCPLPDAQPEQLKQALRLQAEAHMGGTVPPHRQATAILPVAEGETSRTGIIVAWPEAARAPLPPTRRRITFAPDIAALAALLNGKRPTEPLLWIDRHDGSVALAISHANGAILRAARDNAESPQRWQENVGRVIAETALSVGHTPVFIKSLVDAFAATTAGLDHNAAALIVAPPIIDSACARVKGGPDWVGSDPAWWRDYGIALGAVLASTNQNSPLTPQRVAAPVESPSPARRLLDALSNPSAAVKTVTVCLLIAILFPFLVGGLRLGILKAKHSSLQSHLTQTREIQTRLAMYGELQDRAWPMTKLLSDIACNTPQGIDLDQIRIRFGERISLSGRVKPHDDHSAQEVVALMQENLRNSGIVKEIHLNWGDRDNFGAYEFTLSAKVAGAYHRYEYPAELDYGQRTLGDRLYPPASQQQENAEVSAPDELASGDQLPDNSPASSEAPAQPETAKAEIPDDLAETVDLTRPVPLPSYRSGFPGPTAARRSHGDRSGGGASLPPSQNIPEPLTDRQIEVMALPEAQESWARVAHALRRGSLDMDTRLRLQEEFRVLRDHMRTLKTP